jgi:hypothetical protein
VLRGEEALCAVLRVFADDFSLGEVIAKRTKGATRIHGYNLVKSALKTLIVWLKLRHFGCAQCTQGLRSVHAHG